MKLKITFFFLSLSFVTSVSLLAQPVNKKQPQCSASPTKEMMVKYREQVKAEKNFAPTRDGSSFNLPIVFHILRRTNGTGGVSAEDVTREMNWANEKYVSAGIEFFQCSPPEFINDDNLFNTTFDHDWEDFCGQSNAEYQVANAHNVSNVINIYYVNTDGWNWGAFPSALDNCRDWIIMSIADTGSNWLLAHELGHYFNLLHTFQGYEGDDADWENITRDDIIPCCNCATAGDLLCDTEADPNDWSNCAWGGSGHDNCSNNDYNPDEKNIMSYANGCQEYFTAGQIGRIQYAALFLRDYLDCPFLSTCQSSWNLSATQTTMFSYQATDHITSTATINSGVTSSYDASDYVQLNPGFFAKSGCQFRAIPEGCWGPEIFKAEETVHEISGTIISETKSSLYPNPASDITTLSFSISKESEMKIILEDVNGRWQKVILNETLNAGSHTLQLDLNQLSKGVYFVRMIAEDLVETKKLVVQ